MLSIPILIKYRKTPSIFKRIVAHEIAHAEYGECKKKESNYSQIFAELRADLRAVYLSKMSSEVFSKSFTKKVVHIFTDEKKFIEVGYLPGSERKKIISDFNDNFVTSYIAVINYLKTRKYEIPKDIREDIKDDFKKAHPDIPEKESKPFFKALDEYEDEFSKVINKNESPKYKSK